MSVLCIFLPLWLMLSSIHMSTPFNDVDVIRKCTFSLKSILNYTNFKDDTYTKYDKRSSIDIEITCNCAGLSNTTENDEGSEEAWYSSTVSHISCVPLSGVSIQIGIDRCPNNTECYDRKDKTNISNNLPVFDKRYIMYRNAKCSECNGVSDFTYTSLVLSQFDPTKSCDITPDLLKTLHSNKSMMQFAQKFVDFGCDYFLFYPERILNHKCESICKYKNAMAKLRPELDQYEIDVEMCPGSGRGIHCLNLHSVRDSYIEDFAKSLRFSSKSTIVVFQFQKGCEQQKSCGDNSIKYLEVHFVFRKYFAISSSNSEDFMRFAKAYDPSHINFLCLIKRYFNHMNDHLEFHQTLVRVIRNLPRGSSRMNYLYDTKVRLQSPSIFRKIHDIEKIQNWLNNMNITISLIYYDETRRNQTTINLQSINALANGTNIGKVNVFKKFLPKRSWRKTTEKRPHPTLQTCKEILSNNYMPFPKIRCANLNIIFMKNTSGLVITKCSPWNKKRAGGSTSRHSALQQYTWLAISLIVMLLSGSMYDSKCIFIV